jgi:septum formation protein
MSPIRASLGAALRFYLASTSPARLATLRAAGIEPVAIAPGVDEEAAVAAAGPLSPPDMVMLLARLKAEAVAAAHPDLDGLIFGGDSAFELDGAVYGKPHLPEVARERWLAQRGRSGHLHSGHWLIDARADGTGTSIGAAAVATVNFATDITETEIDAYIATGEPLEVAGAFTIDARGAAYIESIEGDPHAVVGLSIPLLRDLTRSLAIEWHDLWNR